MESLYEVTPRLDKQGMFWKNFQALCLQGFGSVHWSVSEFQWYPQFCKFHICQVLLYKAVTEIKESSFVESMKRKQGEEEPQRYLFVVDALLRNHDFSLEEVQFLRQINLEGFVIRITWGVLHEALVREALANLQEETMLTTVQEKEIPLIATDWRTQFRDVFELTNRKVKASTQWKLFELFPSLKTAAEGRETVKVTDCTYPGAKKPLRILSSLFCLNTAGQNHIAIPFAELILAALNGQAVDWPEEFYHSLREEFVKLHKKHSQNPVKAERTTIGPHLTLMIKAAGVMNLPQEIEAGFHTAKPFTTAEPKNPPKKKRFTTAPLPPPTLHNTVRVVQPSQEQTKGASTSAPPQVSETPRSIVIETEEPWQIPNAIPNIIEQVQQVHRRLENLLTTLVSKAPPKLLRELDSQFYRIQRQTALREDTKIPDGHSNPLKSEIFKSQTAQIDRLEKRARNAEELNDVYIEDSFELHNQLSGMQEETDRLKKEIQILTHTNQEQLTTIQDLENANSQQFRTHETELAAMRAQIRNLTEASGAHNLHADQPTDAFPNRQHRERIEITSLQAENRELRAALAAKTPISATKTDSAFGTRLHRPINRAERQALTEGAAEQLLSDLQQELHTIKHEKEELQHQLQKGQIAIGALGLPQTCTHPKSEVFRRLLNHTEPFKSIMQGYHAHAAITLLTSSLPILRKGTSLTQDQFGDIWAHADSKAKDTLAFMWALGDIKLPLGCIEVVTGSPPFFIRRYILRSIASMGQHQANQIRGYHIDHALPSLRPYTHSQKIEIAKLQHQHKEIFQQAINALRGEDTAICFEAARRHQWLLEHYPTHSTQVTLIQLKDYVNQTLEEQQITVTTGRFGTINHGTILRVGLPDRSAPAHHEM